MSEHNELTAFIRETAEKHGIPGVAVGVWADGREVHACHGVTSLENPLPVTPRTLFVLGSVTKTLTATALMRLVEDGRVELDAPVRRYVPELVLRDESAAARITVLNLLNHTAGLDWNLITDTGEGDDALAGYLGAAVGLLPGNGDDYLVTSGGLQGQRGFFTRDASGTITGIDLAGRLFTRVTPPSA